jgi:long-chain acyl-CoA synthetase
MTRELRYEDKPWLRYYAPAVPAYLKYDEIIIPEMLDITVGDFPENPALVCLGYTMTYQELKDQVDRFANCLINLGIKQNDKVSVLLPNCIPIVIAYYAILKIGAVAVMNNPIYADRELLYQFNDSESKLLICWDALVPRMLNIRPETGIQTIIWASIIDYAPPGMAAAVGNMPPAEGLLHFTDCIKQNEPAPIDVQVGWEDTAVLQYTGGTTGLAKGAVLTHKNLSTMIQRYKSWLHDGVRGQDTVMAATPLFHILGMQVAMNLAIYMGFRAVLLPKATPEAMLEAIRKYRVNFAPLVPTHYIGMLHSPDLVQTDLTCFKGMFSGGASLPVDVLRRFEEASKAEICEGFGMSETSPQTHLNPYRGGGPRKPGSIGIPWIDTEVRIVDLETGTHDVPVGEPGEMLFRGPQVTKEYFNKPEETNATITAEGWLHSGDIAYMDEDGYFFVVDRKKDMIISSGYNIYPREIEEVFYEHPKVNKVAAIGLPDPHRGENVGVFLTLKEGQTATPEELLEFATPKLAKYKWPALIEIRDSLPESNVGKLLKKELRDEILKRY